MKDKLRVLKVLNLVASSSIEMRRLDVLVRTEFAHVDSKSLDLSVNLLELLKIMIEEGLVKKVKGYQITESGIRFLDKHLLK